MPEAGPLQLRIYCVCGQKMRVSESMFGQPGKCVSCRQKIRIPKAEEVTWDNGAVFLKDHPELLRGPERASARQVAEGKDGEAPAVVPDLESTAEPQAEAPDAGESGEDDEVLPLEDLEPLRELCSFDHKIQRQLETLRNRPEAASERDALMGYRALVRKARKSLDQNLRADLRHVEDQLRAVEEEISRSMLAVRAGELEFVPFYQLAGELRWRRDAFMRRSQNLRGWLVAESPYLVGGYKDLRLEDVPCEELALPPFEPAATGKSLLRDAMDEVRDALRGRELAARKAGEWKQMAHNGSIAGAAFEDARLGADALRRRSAAQVGFARRRLEQYVRDCESDTKSIKAQLRIARERLQAGAISRPEYQNLEVSLLSLQSDISRAHDLARHALLANTVSDVPPPRGTFLRRLGERSSQASLRWDAYLSWAAALVILVSLAVPYISAAPGGNMRHFPVLVMVLVTVSALVTLVAVLPMRPLRGVLLTVLWVPLVLGVVHTLHEARHGSTAVGAIMRAHELWYLSGGVALLLLAGVLLGMACFLAFSGPARLISLGAIGFVAAISLLLLSDFGGLRRALPALDTPLVAVQDSPFGQFNAALRVSNDGLRPLWIAEIGSARPAAQTLRLDRGTGAGDWRAAGLPISMQINDGPVYSPFGGDTFPSVALHPGEQATFHYNLPPGQYRLRLEPQFAGQQPLERIFMVPEQLALPAITVRPDYERVLEGAGGRSVPRAVSETTASFELGGIINAEGRLPRFYAHIELPGSRETTRYLNLGDQIFGPWHVSEFNPLTKRLTLSDGNSVVVVQSGERITLEAAETQAD